jgi:hypothetical protein
MKTTFYKKKMNDNIYMDSTIQGRIHDFKGSWDYEKTYVILIERYMNEWEPFDHLNRG